MKKNIHAVFDGQALRPVEPLDLKPYCSYIITIKEVEDTPEKKKLLNVLSKLTGKVEGPEDWSEEHDHYLYGTAKKKTI